MTDLNSAADPASPVHTLIQQREQLRGWIAKLDEVAGGAPSRVAERIRQDYADRMARVTAELGEHREEIGRSLESMRAELREAEDRHTHASEAMEEMRLRHLIGELGADEWDTQRVRLEDEVATAENETRRIRGEVERLAALSADVSGDDTPAGDADTAFASAAEQPVEVIAPAEEEVGPPLAFLEEAAAADDDTDTAWLDEISLPGADTPPAAPPAAEADSAANWDPFGNEFGGAAETPQADVGSGDLPWLETPDRPADAWTPASSEGDGLEFLNDLGTAAPETPATGDLAEDDLAFLEELDRAISASPTANRPATPPAPSAPAGGDAAPKGINGGPLLCKECGAINEPHSWYCEICGSEL